MAEHSEKQFDDGWDSHDEFDAIVTVDSHADGTRASTGTDVDISNTESQACDHDGNTSTTSTTAPASGKYGSSYRLGVFCFCGHSKTIVSLYLSLTMQTTHYFFATLCIAKVA